MIRFGSTLPAAAMSKTTRRVVAVVGDPESRRSSRSKPTPTGPTMPVRAPPITRAGATSPLALRGKIRMEFDAVVGDRQLVALAAHVDAHRPRQLRALALDGPGRRHVAIRVGAVDADRRLLEPARLVLARQQHGVVGVRPHLRPVAVVGGEHFVVRRRRGRRRAGRPAACSRRGWCAADAPRRSPSG